MNIRTKISNKLITFLSQIYRVVLKPSLMVSVALVVITSEAAETSIFSYVELSKVESSPPESSSLAKAKASGFKSWAIQLNPEVSGSKVGDTLTFKLPQSTEPIAITINKIRQIAPGETQIFGSYAKQGRLIATINQDAVYANISNNEHNYKISSQPETGQYLMDSKTLPTDAVNLANDYIVPEVIKQRSKLPPKVRAAELKKRFDSAGQQSKELEPDSDITVLAVYSNEFGALFSNPKTKINQLLAFTNDAFQRSGIYINLRLAKAVNLPFANGASSNQLLNQSTNATGDFAGLDAIRDANGADLVVILPSGQPFSASGLAWISGGFANLAYSVSRLSAQCCETVFAHELGHNLGSGHERAAINPNVSVCTDSNNYTGFSCGHGNPTSGWGTVMSNLDDRAINYRFSNLDAACLGEPCGIAEGQVGAADNRSSFNMTRLLVANFRTKTETLCSVASATASQKAACLVPTLNLLID